MNKSILVLIAIFAAAGILFSLEPNTPSQSSNEVKYLAYLKQFNKPIPNDNELFYRTSIFAEFVKKMEAHNADPSQTYKMGINQFSDLTQKEFVTTYLGDLGESEPKTEFNKEVNAGFVAAIDWREKNVVTGVKNQGQCGSCWAFGATAVHEAYQIQYKGQDVKTINLAEQQLNDCSGSYGNNGCNGGLAYNALRYIAENGQTTTSKYPYVARNQNCATKDGSFRIPGVEKSTGCDTLESWLQRSPIAVRVDASNWSAYRSGIFSNCVTNTNHAVFLVATNDSAWTIKNSWGPSWGESGFIRLAKGNTCNVCFGPSRPTL